MVLNLIHIHESERIKLLRISFSHLLDISGDPMWGCDPAVEKHWAILLLLISSLTFATT